MNEEAQVYAQRLAALRDVAADEGMRTLVLVDPANVMHLTGYWTILSTMMPEALVITPHRATLVAPALERAAVDALRLPWIDLLGFRAYPLRVGQGVDPARTFVEALRACLERPDAAPLGLELEGARQTVVRELRALVTEEIVDVGPILRRLRAEKDGPAMARIRRAADIAAEAAAAGRSRVARGATEQEVAGAVAERIWASGARASHIVVGSGPRSVILHAEPTERVLKESDLVVMDIGVLVDGYWAEIARTAVAGRPSAEQVHWHRTVLAAQEAAAAALKAGVPGHGVDAAARQVITAAGYDGVRFNHSTGHGLGLLGMDLPAIAPNSTDRLPSAGALTLEPGLYFDGRGGVRIEDTYLLERGRVEEVTGWVSKDLLAPSSP